MKKEHYPLTVSTKLAFTAIVVLLGLNEQRNRLEPILAEDIDVIDVDVSETVTIGNAQARAAAKRYYAVSGSDRSKAFAALCGMPYALEDTALGWRIFLLCLLSTVADLVICALPGLPIVVLSGLATAPRVLRLFIKAFSPFRELTGKHSNKIQRPAVMEAVASFGSTTISVDPADYLGGKVKISGYGKLSAWLPLALVPVVIAANAPAPVVEAALSASPLALLVICGTRKISTSRHTFRWDGTAFEAADLSMVEQIEGHLALCQAELMCFGEHIRAKKSRRERIIEGMTGFYPVSHVGRFTKVLDADPEIRLWAAALSTFRELLRFASEKAGWCSREEAERWLMAAWSAVLPESAPTPPSENAVAVRGDSIAVFWAFLAEYVRERLPLVTDKPRSRSNAIATLAAFKGENHLVFPRGQLTTEFNRYLDQHGGAPISAASEGIALARLLHDSWTLQIRTEFKEEDGAEDRGDLTWRFQFYAKGTAPKGQRDKLPCIAIPLTALPDELRSLFNGCSDRGSGEDDTSPAARAAADVGMTEVGAENV